jgi:hypothetical protein
MYANICNNINKYALSIKSANEHVLNEKAKSDIIDDALAYASTLVGIKYEWWAGHDLFRDGKPFWVGEGEVSRVNIDSCSCTGLLNLIRRKCGLKVPGANDKTIMFPGGTKIWIDYLFTQSIKLKNDVEIFDAKKHYPKGSLLVVPIYKHGDQGHVAIIYTDDDKENPLNNKLIHSYPACDKFVPHLIGPGITVENIAYSHNFFDGGLYKYVFSPETWLSH